VERIEIIKGIEELEGIKKIEKAENKIRTDDIILVLKTIEIITSKVFELDITKFLRIVKIAINIKHSIVPDY
jgi:hypothetical protein